MIDMFDNLVDSMLNLDIDSSFSLNDRMQCTLNERFCDWHKDNNSSSEFSEAHVDINSSDGIQDGLVVVQRDVSLSHKYYAALYLKDKTADKWQDMFTVVEIDL